MPDMPANLPPQVMQALQQQQQAGASGADVGQILQQLMEMSPDEVAQVLQQMFGVQVSADEVQNAAENWVDQAAGSASGSSPDDETTEATPDSETAEGESNPPSSAANLEDAEATAGEQPASEGDEGELPANAQPTGYQGGGGAGMPSGAMPAMPSGGGAMPRMPRGGPTGPSVPGGSMDDLVSAAMMQSVAGNPNAAVPVSARGAIPNPRPSGAADNTRNAAMIADLYRSTGGKTGKQRTPSAKPSTKA